MKQAVTPADVEKYSGKSIEDEKDLVVTEEPLEIRLKYFDGIDFRERRLAVTMRTPGHDFELAYGFLLSEGIVSGPDEVHKIFYCEEIKDEMEEGNVVIVHLDKKKIYGDDLFNRNFYMNSSCGVCGKSSIESIEAMCDLTKLGSGPNVKVETISKLPDIAAQDQSVFKFTGGIHASALFNEDGDLEIIREDVGRHNALDKLIGARTIEGKSNENSILFISGRAGFELVQKTVMAGIPVLVAVGAPSSLAVDLARQFNLTLIGFARGGKFNVYSAGKRIIN